MAVFVGIDEAGHAAIILVVPTRKRRHDHTDLQGRKHILLANERFELFETPCFGPAPQRVLGWGRVVLVAGVLRREVGLPVVGAAASDDRGDLLQKFTSIAVRPRR